MRRLLSILVMSSCLLAGLPRVSLADGLTLFSGVKHEDQLNYNTDYGGHPGENGDRYRLRIPGDKMKLAVSEFAISYPRYFDGAFDPKKVEVITGGVSVPVSEVKWDKDGQTIEIYPKDPVPAGDRVEIQLSNVTNPSTGMYYFNCKVLSPGDVPLLRPIGTWIISIQND